MPSKALSLYFSSKNTPYGSGVWASILNMKGWVGGDSSSGYYSSWQLAGPAHQYLSTSNTPQELYFRTGAGNSWGEWKRLISNAPNNKSGESVSYSAISNGTYGPMWNTPLKPGNGNTTGENFWGGGAAIFNGFDITRTVSTDTTASNGHKTTVSGTGIYAKGMVITNSLSNTINSDAVAFWVDPLTNNF